MSEAAQAALLAAAAFAWLGATGRLPRLALEFATRLRRGIALGLLFLVILLSVGLPFVSPPAAESTDFSLPALFTGHFVLSLFLVAWWWLRRPITWGRFLFVANTKWADLAAGLRLGLRVWGFTLGIALAISLLAQLLLGDRGLPQSVETPELPAVMIWMVELPISAKALIVLVAMTVEEAFFRAFLQTRIGLVPSSVLFALAHASYGLPTLMVAVLIVSLLLGRDFARHQSLARCMIGHGVFDAIQLIVVVPLAVEQLQQMQLSG